MFDLSEGPACDLAGLSHPANAEPVLGVPGVTGCWGCRGKIVCPHPKILLRGAQVTESQGGCGSEKATL